MKERVIGATVLVGLAVWFVPLVLDGPLPDADTAAARAPAAGSPAPLRTQTIRLENRQVNTARGDARGGPDSPAPQEPAEAAGAVPGASPSARPGASAAMVPNRSAADARGGAPSASAPAVAAGARPGGGAPSGAGSPSAPPAKAGPGWLVQAGSFEAEENARRLAGRLADAGYPARLYPHTTGGRQMFRVRVGPVPSREGAEEIASSLLAKDFRAQVVSGD